MIKDVHKTVRMTTAMNDNLIKIAERYKTTISNVIRKAITEYMDK